MNKIELNILPDKNLIPTAVAAVQEYARLYFSNEKDIKNIGLSVEEAIANVTEFFIGNRTKYINIGANGRNGQFIITVNDTELPGDIFKGKTGSRIGRGSFVTAMRMIKDNPKTIYVKEEYQSFIKDICNNLGIERTISDEAYFSHDKTVVKEEYVKLNEVYIPVDDPAAPIVMDLLLKYEFFPIRYFPCSEGLDFMVFTKMYSDPVYYEDLITVSPYTEMVERIKEFDPSHK